jgi:hypothetical protein
MDDTPSVLAHSSVWEFFFGAGWSSYSIKSFAGSTSFEANDFIFSLQFTFGGGIQ